MRRGRPRAPQPTEPSITSPAWTRDPNQQGSERELHLRLNPGHLDDSQASRLREFAARNRLAYSWIDLDNDPVAPALLRTLGLELRDTPVVLLGGTEVLVNPSNSEFATAAGIAEDPVPGSVYDLLVIGAGPAGLGAAVYGATEGLSTAVIDALAAGGQASTTLRIENYLGFPTGVSGTEFGERAQLQAQRLGAQMFVDHAAVSLSHSDGYNHVSSR